MSVKQFNSIIGEPVPVDPVFQKCPAIRATDGERQHGSRPWVGRGRPIISTKQIMKKKKKSRFYVTLSQELRLFF
jgi:hypothetical protein